MTRLEGLIAHLRTFYGVLPSPPADPFTLFVWEVLAARTTPHRRDAAVAALRRIPALTPDALWRAPQGPLESAVRAAGPYVEQRLQALRTGVDAFRRHPALSTVMHARLLQARRAVAPLPHVGEGVAHRMLLFAGAHLVLPVDTGTMRVATRLGYGHVSGSHRKQLRAVRQALVGELPPLVDAYRQATVHLCHHAVATCTDADPHCGVCPLGDDCDYRRGLTNPTDAVS